LQSNVGVRQKGNREEAQVHQEKNSILYNLLWVHDPAAAYDASHAPVGREATAYRAPSWSWTSVNGRVCWRQIDIDSGFCAQLVDFTVAAEDASNDYGEIAQGAKIVFSEPLLPIGRAVVAYR
jgi:hypothetical protein